MFANHDTCDTSIVYVSNKQVAETIDELCVKRLADDCHLFFTRNKDYYYFYDGLIHRLILWSRHPRALGKEGLEGSYVTIGSHPNRNTFDIHHTQYSYMAATVGTYKIIVPKAQHTYYKPNRKMELPETAPPYARAIWDEMWCKENAMAGGAKPEYKRLLKTTPSRHQEATAPYTTAKKRLSAAAFAKGRTNGAIRVPYTPRHKMLDLAKQICEEGLDMKIVSHHWSRSTLVWVTSR